MMQELRRMAGLDVWIVVLLAMLVVLSAGLASAEPGTVQQRTLANGLEVLVQETHSAPLVCSFIWYRVGLLNERPGEAGLTHFLEHMAFKGTERYTGREMDRLVTERGGYLNGFTSMDYTAYVETLPRDCLELAFEIESERMARCRLSADDIESEKGVVLSEFEGAENDPGFLLRRRVMEEQFPDQPYGRTVIGKKEDLRSLSQDQVASYYQRHYAPNNALLVVVGDVRADDVFASADRFFGRIPRGEPAPPAPNPGRGATGEKRVSLEVPGRTSFLQGVYEVPAIQHPDHVVLEVLQNVLSSGRTSRLYRALVDTGLASHAGGWDYENPQPTAFAFDVALRPGVQHQQVEDALDAVIQKLSDEPVPERELTKAKNKTKAHFVYAADGVTKLAQQIGYYHLIHDYEYLHTFPAKVDAVTADDIRRVVGKYFTSSNHTVGWLVAGSEQGSAGPTEGAHPQDSQRRYRPDPPFAADTVGSGGPVPAPPGVGPVPQIYDIVLPNGLRAIIQQNSAAPFVALDGNMMAGPVFDPPGKAGLAAFCAEMLSRGTQRRTWPEIREGAV
jgi:zinc protease